MAVVAMLGTLLPSTQRSSGGADAATRIVRCDGRKVEPLYRRRWQGSAGTTAMPSRDACDDCLTSSPVPPRSRTPQSYQQIPSLHPRGTGLADPRLQR